MAQPCLSLTRSALGRKNIGRVPTALPIAALPSPYWESNGVRRMGYGDHRLDPLAQIVGLIIDRQRQGVGSRSAALQLQPLVAFLPRLLARRADAKPNAIDAGDSCDNSRDRCHEVVGQPRRQLHFQSPVLSDNRTVRAAAGGVIPRASGGNVKGGR